MGSADGWMSFRITGMRTEALIGMKRVGDNDSDLTALSHAAMCKT